MIIIIASVWVCWMPPINCISFYLGARCNISERFAALSLKNLNNFDNGVKLKGQPPSVRFSRRILLIVNLGE